MLVILKNQLNLIDISYIMKCDWNSNCCFVSFFLRNVIFLLHIGCLFAALIGGYSSCCSPVSVRFLHQSLIICCYLISYALQLLIILSRIFIIADLLYLYPYFFSYLRCCSYFRTAALVIFFHV
jgi:hypothetical protein